MSNKKRTDVLFVRTACTGGFIMKKLILLTEQKKSKEERPEIDLGELLKYLKLEIDVLIRERV